VRRRGVAGFDGEEGRPLRAVWRSVCCCTNSASMALYAFSWCGMGGGACGKRQKLSARASVGRLQVSRVTFEVSADVPRELGAADAEEEEGADVGQSMSGDGRGIMSRRCAASHFKGFGGCTRHTSARASLRIGKMFAPKYRSTSVGVKCLCEEPAALCILKSDSVRRLPKS